MDQYQATTGKGPIVSEPIGGLCLAIQFLTVFPIRFQYTPKQADAGMTPALPWFPVVGAGIGFLLALGDWIVQPILADGVRNALILAASAIMTGMLHLDGFVDCCDGLPGNRAPEKRLEIMRDSRVGAFGALGAVLLLLCQFTALAALPYPLRGPGIILVNILGRWAIVLAMASYPYARAVGLGTMYHPTRRILGLTTLVMTATGGILWLLALLWSAIRQPSSGTMPFTGPPLSVILSYNSIMLASDFVFTGLLAFLVTLGFSRWASRKLGGGLTGDTYGAVHELVVLGCLIGLPIMAQVTNYLVFR